MLTTEPPGSPWTRKKFKTKQTKLKTCYPQKGECDREQKSTYGLKILLLWKGKNWKEPIMKDKII